MIRTNRVAAAVLSFVLAAAASATAAAAAQHGCTTQGQASASGAERGSLGGRPQPVYGRQLAAAADLCTGASPRGCADGAAAAGLTRAEPTACIGASPRGCGRRPADAA